MLLEWLPFELPAATLHLIFGALLGLAFGAAAQISRFCLRRAVAGEGGADTSAGSVWLMALAFAVGGFAIAQSLGWVAVEDHRLLTSSVPVVALLVGGAMFGAGMVLTRGCISRLTVLGASGNLRALSVLIVVAIVAHAAMKGILAPVRLSLGSMQVDTGLASLAEISGLPFVLAALLLGAAVILGKRSDASLRDLSLGAVIGTLVVAGWVGTSFALYDDFDPMPIQSIAFTLPWTDTLFWTIASTAITPGFGVGLIGGVFVGAFLSAALRKELEPASFDSPRQTLRYTAGGALMGLGGVLAGGCTVGAGLAGGAMLSVSALIALASIIVSAVVTRSLLEGRGVPQPA